ncbi:MAG TPA: hypothetical protein VGC42_06730 [Kofleriaceae bacterium]
MRVPVWLTLLVALLVSAFGLYRIWLAIRSARPVPDGGPAPRGIYAMRKRTHLLIGIVYLLLGGALLATSYGFNPFGNLFGPPAQAPTKETAPTRGRIQVDQLPATK